MKRTYYSFLDDLKNSLLEERAKDLLEKSSKSKLIDRIDNILVLAEESDDFLKSFKKSFGTITDEQEKFYENVRSSLLEITNELVSLQIAIRKGKDNEE